MLSHQETKRLIELAQKDDNNAKEVLIVENSPLIKSIIRRYRNKGVDYEDLFQLGCMGLLKAIKNFSNDFNVKFSTYAVPLILGEVKRFLRDDGYIKISRSTKALSHKIAYYIEKYQNEHQNSPTIDEIAKEFKIDQSEVVFAMDSALFPVSIYDKGDDEQNQSLLEKLPSEDISEKTIDNLIVRQGINKLSDREKMIINLRYFKDKTQSEVARIMGVSQVQISRIETKIIDKLRGEFK